MARSLGARVAGAQRQELQKLLRQARDAETVPADLAEAVRGLVSQMKYGAVADACRAIGRPEWLTPLAKGDLTAIDAFTSAGAMAKSAGSPAPALAYDSAAASPAPRTSTAKPELPNNRDHHVPAGLRHFATLETDEVLRAHWALVEYFKSSRDPIDPPGVKSADMLESAVSRQQTGYGGVPKYRTLAHLAGALMYGLALNHPFHNGNKRTALLSLMLLLDKNSYVLTAKEVDLFNFVLSVVQHEFRPRRSASQTELLDDEVRAIGSWISAHCRRVDRRLRPIDWRDLRRRLEDLGCETHVLKGNYIEITLGVKKVNLAFGGDDREVGKPTVRQIWRELGLDEDRVYDAAAFYGSGAPVDRFIVRYLEVFQKLAHA